MKTVSIFNHVLGPVMRGRPARIRRARFTSAAWRVILGGTPQRAVLAFDPAGSYAATYAPQGADRGFAMGLMNKLLTDESFFTALVDAPSAGLDLQFQVRPLAGADHPNTVELDLTATDGTNLNLVARSIGGGEVEITRVQGRPVLFNGSAYETLVEVSADQAGAARVLLLGDGGVLEDHVSAAEDGRVRLTVRRSAALPATFRMTCARWTAAHESGDPRRSTSCKRAGPCFPARHRWYRSPNSRAFLWASWRCLRSSIARHQPGGRVGGDVAAIRHHGAIRAAGPGPQFHRLAVVTRLCGGHFSGRGRGAAVRAQLTHASGGAGVAMMHVDGAMGVVCTAPTGGSAGVIPGTLVTLAEERSLTREQIALALLAAGAIGMILAIRGTFAAEVAGCQVEIGASGAMAAAAVVDAVGGTARQACDAAAIGFQNTMGTVCDLLHGTVEIPCHTRNGAAAASAFVNADLVLGGYTNFIPLDETIDAVYAVGLAMPSELRCTSKGGLAITPSRGP